MGAYGGPGGACCERMRSETWQHKGDFPSAGPRKNHLLRVASHMCNRRDVFVPVCEIVVRTCCCCEACPPAPDDIFGDLPSTQCLNREWAGVWNVADDRVLKATQDRKGGSLRNGMFSEGLSKRPSWNDASFLVWYTRKRAAQVVFGPASTS